MCRVRERRVKVLYLSSERDKVEFSERGEDSEEQG